MPLPANKGQRNRDCRASGINRIANQSRCYDSIQYRDRDCRAEGARLAGDERRRALARMDGVDQKRQATGQRGFRCRESSADSSTETSPRILESRGDRAGKEFHLDQRQPRVSGDRLSRGSVHPKGKSRYAVD